MAFDQQQIYDELREQFTKHFEDKGDLAEDFKQHKNGKKGKKSEQDTAGGGSRMLMDLRKAANHHLLHRRQYTDDKLRQMAKLMLKVCSATSQTVVLDDLLLLFSSLNIKRHD